jgi:hypothetical protein
MAKREIILTAGVEGGGVTLYGERTPNGWRFRTSYADQTPLMLDEPEIRREVSWVATWDEALALLDMERWQRLPAIRVHPEFRTRVWVEARKRLPVDASTPDSRNARLLARWREKCEIEDY